MQRLAPLNASAVTPGESGGAGDRPPPETVADGERELRAMFDLAGSGKAILNPDGRLVRVNRRFCEITGTAEELMEREVAELTHPADRARDATAVEAALRGETEGWNVEKRYLRKDGQIAWVVVTGTVLRDAAGAPVRTVATVHDITARKRIEEELRANEELLRLAQRAAHAGVWELDLVAGTAWMSSECHALYGTALAARGPDIASWRRRVVPEDAPAVAAALDTAVERGEEYSTEFRIHHPALGERWIWEIGGAEYDASGAPARVRGIALDVTERKHGEQALVARRPAQGPLPRRALARAAQPARADVERARRARADRRDRGHLAPRPGRAATAARAPVAAGGRPARRDPHLAREDRAPPRAARARATSCGAPPRTTARSSTEARRRARRRRSRTPGWVDGGRDPPRAGRREPAPQRRQVHARAAAG